MGWGWRAQTSYPCGQTAGMDHVTHECIHVMNCVSTMTMTMMTTTTMMTTRCLTAMTMTMTTTMMGGDFFWGPADSEGSTRQSQGRRRAHTIKHEFMEAAGCPCVFACKLQQLAWCLAEARRVNAVVIAVALAIAVFVVVAVVIAVAVFIPFDPQRRLHLIIVKWPRRLSHGPANDGPMKCLSTVSSCC